MKQWYDMDWVCERIKEMSELDRSKGGWPEHPTDEYDLFYSKRITRIFQREEEE